MARTSLPQASFQAYIRISLDEIHMYVEGEEIIFEYTQ